MAQYQVVCVTKRGGLTNSYERITHLGLLGGTTPYTQEQIISWIESGTHSFYVASNPRAAWVIVANRNGRKYLKTQADGEEPNNLLSLPEC